jgi:hypothetical protein
VGLDNFQSGYRNQFSVDTRLANGIPQTQLDAELAYLAAHPEITGEGNWVSNAVEGSDNTPYRMLSTVVEKENIIAVNLDINNPDLFEIVYIQANPNRTTRSIVHVIIDPLATSALKQSIPDFDKFNVLFDKSNIPELLKGNIDSIQLYIFMNSTANADLVDDPAFALSKKIVQQVGNGNELYLFTNAPDGSSDEALHTLSVTISGITYITPYAIVP